MKIILSLKESKKSVNELSKNLKTEQSKISHALASLKCCNIVKASKKGKHRIYELNKKTIIPILKIIEKHSKTFCKGECLCEKGGK